MLVDAGDRAGDALMIPFQSAQRRALYQLTELGVPWGAGLRAALLLPLEVGRRRAVIGHRSGEITLDLDEADPARREQIRATLGEHYRTPLGHIRHELGHFVWLNLVASDPERLDEFRELFGDERVDYAAALDAHYARIDDGTWRDDHASFYASAHPWEDFAESWAQLMHVHDVVETGAAWGVVTRPGRPADARPGWRRRSRRASPPTSWPGRWACATSTRSPSRRACGPRSSSAGASSTSTRCDHGDPPRAAALGAGR